MLVSSQCASQHLHPVTNTFTPGCLKIRMPSSGHGSPAVDHDEHGPAPGRRQVRCQVWEHVRIVNQHVEGAAACTRPCGRRQQQIHVSNISLWRWEKQGNQPSSTEWHLHSHTRRGSRHSHTQSIPREPHRASQHTECSNRATHRALQHRTFRQNHTQRHTQSIPTEPRTHRAFRQNRTQEHSNRDTHRAFRQSHTQSVTTHRAFRQTRTGGLPATPPGAACQG